MNHFFTSAIMCAVGISAMGQTVCLETGFSEGMPDDFTLICHDEMPVNNSAFKNLIPSMTWFTAKADSEDGRAAMSTSRRSYDMDTDNWLITPLLSIPADEANGVACLKWTARSIHYHLRDGYKVMVSTTGTGYEDFVEIASVEAEEYLWTKHYVSLADYAGKEIYIAFVHNSRNKFMLAIDDIFVGQPSEADFIVTDDTRRFAGNVGSVPVTGSACNSGVALKSQTLKCVINDTDTITSALTDEAWGTGAVLDFHFDVPVTVGEATYYKVMAEGNTVVEDSIICSYFPRKIFLEKATGYWCTNCPEVIPYIHSLKERYKDDFVYVEVHGFQNDLLEYTPYLSGMKVVNLPTMYINRDMSKPLYGADASSRNTVKKMLSAKPTIAKVDLTLDYQGGDSLNAVSKVTFAIDTDNATGKYRVGYALIEKEILNVQPQINGCASVSHGEYYYLVSPIPANMMYYSNVVRSMESAFVGIKNSLPTTIEGGVEYTVETKLGIPSTVYDRNEVAIVAIVMNYYTDEVLNVCEVHLPYVANAIHGVESDASSASSSDLQVNANGTCHVSCPDATAFSLEVIATDGSRVASFTGAGTGVFELHQVAPKGLYLVRLVTSDGSLTKKVML